MKARFLLITALIYLVLLWFISGIAYHTGLTFFCVGIGLLLPALWAFRRGFTKPLFCLYFVSLLMALLIGGMELVLLVSPNILSGKAALSAYNGYHTDPGGIYLPDKHLGLTFRRNYSRRIYWNGHWWLHKANNNGYRGEAIDRADAVFLGDSMIYGHGVNEEDTVSARFRDQTGLKVANLGQQGTCLVQMWLRYRAMAPRLRPRYLFVCSHFNDVTDATYFYPQDQLKRFVAGSMEEDYLPTIHPKLWDSCDWNAHRLWNHYVALPLRSAGLFRYLRRAIRNGRQSSAQPVSVPQSHHLPSQAMVEWSFEPWAETATEKEQLGWKAHVHALRKLKHLCDQHGTTLVLFDLGYPTVFCAAIEKEARKMGVAYVPAGRAALEKGYQGQEVYLKNDGHWTGTGAKIVAAELATVLTDKNSTGGKVIRERGEQ